MRSRKVRNLEEVFDQHVKHEFVDNNVKATMETMVEEPYVYNVSTGTGGNGRMGVYKFYENQLVGNMP